MDPTTIKDMIDLFCLKIAQTYMKKIVFTTSRPDSELVNFEIKSAQMAHFTINLPDNEKAEVYYGKVFRKHFILNPFRRNHISASPKTGYKIVLKDSGNSYMIYRSVNDNWSSDPAGNVEIREQVLLDIKEAILEKERN
jgi:hypothetical protein